MAVTKSSPFIVPLESNEGQKLLKESQYEHLLPYFCKQIHSKYCGLCSAAICLNEILDKRRSLNNFHRDISKLVQLKDRKKTFGEDDVFAIGEERSVFRKEDVIKEGITLDTFAKLIKSIGLRGSFYFAFDSTSNQDSTMRKCPGIFSVDEFRSITLENLKKPGTHVVVNYLFSTLFTGVNMGHFSPKVGTILERTSSCCWMYGQIIQLAG